MEVSTKIHSLLTPDNCTVILIDYQPQMVFGVESMDRQILVNNAVGLAKAAKIFKIPTILTTVAKDSFIFGCNRFWGDHIYSPGKTGSKRFCLCDRRGSLFRPEQGYLWS